MARKRQRARVQPAKGHHPHRAEQQTPQREHHPRPMRKPVRRTPAWVAPTATLGGIALVVVAFLAIRYMTTPAPLPPAGAETTAAVVSAITSLQATELDQVGLGSATNVVQPGSGAPLTGAGGKPVVFYYGAEYCPFCAAERWPLIISLARFGTFSGLQTSSSSSSDAYPNTATFTFHGATYTSQYIELQAVEATDRDGRTLETLNAAQQAIVSRLDPSNGIPFLDLGNKYVLPRASYQPDVLSGMSWKQIADALSNPDSSQAKAILGSANLVTAGICVLTSNQPSTACTPAIQALEPKL